MVLPLPLSLNRHAHCVYRIYVHIVFVTKYRRQALTPDMLKRLEDIFAGLCSNPTWKSRLVEFGGEADHVHLLIDLAPDAQISGLVNTLKTISSRMIRREFAQHLARFYNKPALWTKAYCALSAGGAPLEVLKCYIAGQDGSA